jgi:hypothetical protein
MQPEYPESSLDESYPSENPFSRLQTNIRQTVTEERRRIKESLADAYTQASVNGAPADGVQVTMDGGKGKVSYYTGS